MPTTPNTRRAPVSPARLSPPRPALAQAKGQAPADPGATAEGVFEFWRRSPEAFCLQSRALFAAWDRSLTDAQLDDRVSDVRLLLRLRAGTTSIRELARDEGILGGPKDQTFCRFRDRILQRHRRRRIELLAVLHSSMGRRFFSENLQEVVFFLSQTRRPPRRTEFVVAPLLCA